MIESNVLICSWFITRAINWVFYFAIEAPGHNWVFYFAIKAPDHLVILSEFEFGLKHRK